VSDMRYAVNVADMAYPDVAALASIALGPFVAKREVVSCGAAIDNMAVVLECDEKRAKALCEVLNMKGRKIRCYAEGPRGGWSRLKIETRKSVKETT